MAITTANLYVNDYDANLGDLIGTLKLTSPNFENNNEIPKQFRYDYGDNINPILFIDDAPDQTKSFVLTLEDIDDPTRSLHWLVFNIPGKTKVIQSTYMPTEAIVGKNDLTEYQYYGPCPLQGKHEYKFTLYALDKKLKFDKDVSREELWNAIVNNIIDIASLNFYATQKEEVALE